MARTAEEHTRLMRAVRRQWDVEARRVGRRVFTDACKQRLRAWLDDPVRPASPVLDLLAYRLAAVVDQSEVLFVADLASWVLAHADPELDPKEARGST